MLDITRVAGAIKAGTASIKLVRGNKIYVHLLRKTFCQDTGKEGPEARDVFALDELAKHYLTARAQAKQYNALVKDFDKFFDLAVKAEKEGSFSQDLTESNYLGCRAVAKSVSCSLCSIP